MMMLSVLLAVEVESLTKSAVVADRGAKVAVFVQCWKVKCPFQDFGFIRTPSTTIYHPPVSQHKVNL